MERTTDLGVRPKDEPEVTHVWRDDRSYGGRWRVREGGGDEVVKVVKGGKGVIYGAGMDFILKGGKERMTPGSRDATTLKR